MKVEMPDPTGFPCPRCGAASGEPCTGRMRGKGPFHAGRIDAALHAMRKLKEVL